MNVLHILLDNITLKNIELILVNYYLSISISLALFICVLLVLRVFVKYSFLTLKILICWIIASFISLIYLTNGDSTSIVLALNSQVVLMAASIVILFSFYIFELIFKKPSKKIKKYGKNSWWVGILSFIVTLAFCVAFNIILYVSCIIVYL